MFSQDHVWASGRHVLVQWGTITPLRPLCTWTGDFLIFNLGSLQKKEGLHPSGAGEENTASFRAHAWLQVHTGVRSRWWPWHNEFSVFYRPPFTRSLPRSLLSVVNVFENRNVTSQRIGGFPRHSHLGCILEDKSSQLPLLTLGADTQVPNIQISGAGDHARKTKTQMPRMHCLCKFWHFLHIPPCH